MASGKPLSSQSEWRTVTSAVVVALEQRRVLGGGAETLYLFQWEVLKEGTQRSLHSLAEQSDRRQ